MPRAKRVQTIDTYNFFQTGSVTVGTSKAQLTATSLKTKKGVLVKADVNNAGEVYVGPVSVTAGSPDSTSGLQLSANDSVELEVADVSDVYVIASAAGQKVYWLIV